MEHAVLSPDQADLVDAFNRNGVEFLVIGAHAMGYHGYIRATGDFDVFVEPTSDNAQRVFLALKEFGVPVALWNIGPEDFANPGKVIQIGQPPFRVDIITEMTGISFEEAAECSLMVTAGPLAFRIPAVEALIKNKRALAREKDLVDVSELEALRKASQKP